MILSYQDFTVHIFLKTSTNQTLQIQALDAIFVFARDRSFTDLGFITIWGRTIFSQLMLLLSRSSILAAQET